MSPPSILLYFLKHMKAVPDDASEGLGKEPDKQMKQGVGIMGKASKIRACETTSS